MTVTSDESKLINMEEKPKVIVSAAGMCDAGRTRHHLKRDHVATGVLLSSSSDIRPWRPIWDES